MLILFLVLCIFAKPLKFQRNVRCTNANIRLGKAIEDIDKVANLVRAESQCGSYFQILQGSIFCVSKGSRCRQKMDSGNTVYDLSHSHDLKPMTGDGFYAEGGEYEHFHFNAVDDGFPSDMGNPEPSTQTDSGLTPDVAPPQPEHPGKNYEYANAYYPKHQFDPPVYGSDQQTRSNDQYPEFVPNYFGGYEYLAGSSRGEFERGHQDWAHHFHAGHEKEESEGEDLPPPPKSDGRHPLQPWSFNGDSGYVQQGPFGGYGPVKPNVRLGRHLPKDKCEGRCSAGQLCIARTCVEGPREICGEGEHCKSGEFCHNDVCMKVMDFRNPRLYNKQ